MKLQPTMEVGDRVEWRGEIGTVTEIYSGTFYAQLPSLPFERLDFHSTYAWNDSLQRWVEK